MLTRSVGSAIMFSSTHMFTSHSPPTQRPSLMNRSTTYKYPVNARQMAHFQTSIVAAAEVYRLVFSWTVYVVERLLGLFLKSLVVANDGRGCGEKVLPDARSSK